MVHTRRNVQVVAYRQFPDAASDTWRKTVPPQIVSSFRRFAGATDKQMAHEDNNEKMAKKK